MHYGSQWLSLLSARTLQDVWPSEIIVSLCFVKRKQLKERVKGKESTCIKGSYYSRTEYLWQSRSAQDMAAEGLESIDEGKIESLLPDKTKTEVVARMGSLNHNYDRCVIIWCHALPQSRECMMKDGRHQAP